MCMCVQSVKDVDDVSTQKCIYCGDMIHAVNPFMLL